MRQPDLVATSLAKASGSAAELPEALSKSGLLVEWRWLAFGQSLRLAFGQPEERSSSFLAELRSAHRDSPGWALPSLGWGAGPKGPLGRDKAPLCPRLSLPSSFAAGGQGPLGPWCVAKPHSFSSEAAVIPAPWPENCKFSKASGLVPRPEALPWERYCSLKPGKLAQPEAKQTPHDLEFLRMIREIKALFC